MPEKKSLAERRKTARDWGALAGVLVAVFVPYGLVIAAGDLVYDAFLGLPIIVGHFVALVWLPPRTADLAEKLVR